MTNRQRRKRREKGVDVGELDSSRTRVLCVSFNARRRQNLERAMLAASDTLDRLEAEGYQVRGLQIRGHLLRVKREF